MDKRDIKLKSFAIAKAEAEADLALINQYSLRELTAEDVYCFNVVLCDNEVDRDLDRFTDASLEALAGLFLGKTGIKNHDWDTNNQIARLYRAQVEDTGERNSLGQRLKRLHGSAYMLRNEDNKALIDGIEGGIVKEVSVGVRMKKHSCSICGERLRFDFRTWREKCPNDHVKGESYDGVQCIGLMEDPVEAYEFSFVAVPAQRGAGVTKGLGPDAASVHEAIMKMTVEELAEYPEANEAVIKHLQTAMQNAEEREKRAEIQKAVQQYR